MADRVSVRPRLSPYLVAAFGILIASSAAILIRFALAEHIPPVGIAALRLTIASAVLSLLSGPQARREWPRLTRVERGWAVVGGVALAAHFATWISSLGYTSIMSSVVLVSTNPIFVALASLLFLREAPARFTLFGIVLAIAGGLLIGLADLSTGAESLTGNLLALAGSVAGSIYILIGRRLRKSLSLLPYITLIYGLGAAMLLALALASGTPLWGYTATGWGLILLLAIGPQLLGHSALNYALKYLSATFVAVVLLAEPIGATLLAVPIWGEVPTPVKLAGGALILVGIALAAQES